MLLALCLPSLVPRPSFSPVFGQLVSASVFSSRPCEAGENSLDLFIAANMLGLELKVKVRDVCSLHATAVFREPERL